MLVLVEANLVFASTRGLLTAVFRTGMRNDDIVEGYSSIVEKRS
jgi:hypothetical protein